MIETGNSDWSVSDKKCFLKDTVHRLKHVAAEVDRFGACQRFLKQYLTSLNLRSVNFNGISTFDAAERDEIREYAEELLSQVLGASEIAI